MNELYRAAKPDTNLKLHRLKADLTQKELADASGVPLRTIQQYEQRQKNINKAQAEYLVMLARALCCDVEDILEKSESSADIYHNELGKCREPRRNRILICWHFISRYTLKGLSQNGKIR